MTQMYPVQLDLTGRRALVVGSGKVGARKLRGLVGCGLAELRVVSPDVADAPEGVTIIRRAFEENDLDGIDLCFIATGDAQLNARIVQLCHSRRILANRADRGDEGDFTVPAVYRNGDVTVAVSTSGSPRLAATIRDEIGRSLDPAWGEMARTVSVLRDEILSSALGDAARREVLMAMCSGDAFAAFKRGGEKALKAYLRGRFREIREVARW